VGERASQRGRKGGRWGAGLVSSHSQLEAGVVLCRVNLTLATQWRRGRGGNGGQVNRWLTD